ncbi:MAG: hypothetical protein C0602_09260 [Denitrovibrio sp.]|nr:MAG: hypothetical protein C0602_09260 [Denitrovibrio sp.]
MSFIITFLSVLIFWILLSGEFSGLLLGFAVLYSLLVAYFTHDLFVEKFRGYKIRQFVKFLLYIPWLLWQIIIANVQIVRIVIDPKMPIDPEMVYCKTSLKTDLGLTLLGNSITLTPGTVTVDIGDGEILVHGIGEDHKLAIIDQEIEKKIIEIEGTDNV